MFRLPDEGRKPSCPDSQRLRRAAFAFADDLCRDWYEAPWDRRFRPLPGETGKVGIRLTAQAFRLFRSVVEECRRGEAHCGKIVCRGLLETTVAIGFLLMPAMPLELTPLRGHPRTADGILKNRVREILPCSTCGGLSREFPRPLSRDDAFSDHRYYHEMANVPGIGEEYMRTDDESMFGITKKIQAEHERIVGPEWSWVLKKSVTYSGLNFADTTRLVCPHLVHVPHTVYRPLSQDAHAAGAMKHNDWFSSREEIQGALRLSFMCVLRCLDFLQKHLDVDEASGLPLEDWIAKFQSMSV